MNVHLRKYIDFHLIGISFVLATKECGHPHSMWLCSAFQ